MTRIIGTVNDPGRVTATILAAVKGTGFDYAGEWDAETTYEKNKIVSIQSRLGLFKSLKAANTGNTPPASTDEWWEVVTAIPGEGVVNSESNISSDDIPTYGLISYILSENYLGITFAEKLNQILAPADVWTARATNGATFQVDETPTNDQVKGGFVFVGTTVSQGIQLQIKNLNNELFTTPKFKVKIHSKATNVAELNGGVVWAVRGVWQGAAMDQAWSDPVFLSQNLADVNTVYSTAFSDEVRVTAPETLTNGSLLIEIYRALDEAGDKNENSAVILDVEILINQ